MAEADYGGAVRHPTTRQSWVSGLELFAAVAMMLIGLFHIIEGVEDILRGSFYVVTANYLYTFNVSGWAWIHLILGIVVGLTGIFLMRGQSWARIAGMVIVSISAVANFLFIPYQPAWSLLIIAIDVAVIWALAVHRRELKTQEPASTS